MEYIYNTVHQWSHLFDESEDNKQILSKHPKIRMQIAYEENHLEFYPSLEDLVQTCQEVTQNLATNLRNLPIVESWLLGSSDPMNVQLDEDRLVACNKHLEEQLRRLFVSVQEYLDQYNENYAYLVDGRAESEVNDFIMSEPDFAQSCDKINSFKEMITKITDEPSFVYLQLCRLDCDDAKHNLRMCTKRLMDRLICS